jgi:hypothetical protein
VAQYQVERWEQEEGMETTLLKKNLIKDSEENEENGYPVPDPNKTMIIDPNEPNDAHKNTLKEEILQEITENFMEKILDMFNQNVQDVLKKFQDTKKKKRI